MLIFNEGLHLDVNRGYRVSFYINVHKLRCSILHYFFLHCDRIKTEISNKNKILIDGSKLLQNGEETE